MAVSQNGTQPSGVDSVEGGNLPAGAASENVAFLADIGLVIEEAAGKFKPTGVAMQFINTAASDESRGRRLLRSIVSRLWFAKAAAAFRQAHPDAQGSELTRFLAGEAQAPAGEGAAAVLVEYLTYCGLVPAAAPSVEAAPSVDREESQPTPSKRPGARAKPGGRPGADASGWKSVRTDDFELRVRADPTVIRRLRKHLDLLEEEFSAE